MPIVQQTKQKKLSTNVTRAQIKKSMHERYHAQAHNFANNKTLRRLRANGQSATKTKFGFNMIVPPTIWEGMPPRVIRDSHKPPYTRAEMRAMRNGVYVW